MQTSFKCFNEHIQILNDATKELYLKAVKLIPLNPSKLRRSTGKIAIVRTFPGETTSIMNHYVKPTLEKIPDLIILDVGTNDIQYK